MAGAEFYGWGIHCDQTFPYRPIDGVTKRIALAEAQNWRCAYCGIACELLTFENRFDPNVATIDELEPRANGGRRLWINQVMACRLCNNGRDTVRPLRYFLWVQQYGREGAVKRRLNGTEELIVR
jgi:5-methylcytosine-specific restriction endonuclease McrA